MSRFNNFVFFLAFSCFCFANGFVVRAYAENAAEAPAANGQEAKAKAPGLRVVVTASRGQEQDPLDVPQAVDSIDRSDFESNEYIDVDDALRSLPNVGLAPSEGTPNFWQQGFTIRGLGAQRVLTLSDGVRQAGQGIGYGGGNLSLYDTFGIEKIEVIKGPASVLYGTDAFGGVVNVITRNPKQREQFGYSAGGRYVFDASRDMNRAGAYLDFGDKNWGTVLGGSYTHSQNPNLPDGEDPVSGRYRELGLWTKTDFHLGNDSKLRFLANIDRNRDVLITEQQIDLPIAVFGPPGSFDVTSSPLYFNFPLYQRSNVGAEYSAENLGGAFEYFKTGLYWQQLYRRFHRETAFYPTFSPGFAGPPTFINPSASVTQSVTNTNDHVNTFEWQTQGRWSFDPHVITLGLDAGYDRSRLPESEDQQVIAVAGFGLVDREPTSVERLRADADQYRVGAYIQDSWAWNKFEIVPGVRGDYYSVNDAEGSFDDQQFGVSGSLGTLWHQSDRQSLYLNLATGFRAPDLGERFQDGIVNLGAPSRIIGKNDLDPERSYSAEWGIKRRDSLVETEAALFASHIQDYIGTRNLGVVNGFVTDQYDNIGSVNLYGTEGAMRVHVTDRWSVYANAGRTWSKQTEKIDLRNWVFNYGTDYTQPVEMLWVSKLTAGVNARTVLNSVDHTATGGAAKFAAPGFTVVDLKLVAELTKASFGKGSVIAGLRNLFNRSYQEPFFSMLQPERSVFVGVQLDY